MSTDLDPRRPYRLSPTVSLRPERFGALVYDFATRRLSFLKTPTLTQIVRDLDQYPDVDTAMAAAGVPAAEHDQYLKALDRLLAAGTIHPLPPDEGPP